MPASSTFTTTGCGALVNNISALIIENIILQDFSIAPNLATYHMEIGYAPKREAESSIDIFNWQSQIVNSRHLGIQDAAYYVPKYDDVITLPTSLYIIPINTNDRVLATQKYLKIE